MSDGLDEGDTPAERRLAEYMALVRAHEPQPSTALVLRVVRAARWQRLVRAPLRVVGMIAASALDTLGHLFGRTRGPSR